MREGEAIRHGELKVDSPTVQSRLADKARYGGVRVGLEVDAEHVNGVGGIGLEV